MSINSSFVRLVLTSCPNLTVQDLRRHTIYSMAKKGARVFKLLSTRPHLKILTEPKITDSPIKQVLNVVLGI